MHNVVLWDNDGVLVNSEVLYYEANKRFFSQYEIDLSVDLYLEHFLCSSAGAWHLMRDKGWNDTRIAYGKGERNEIYTSLLENSADLAVPGIEEVLRHFTGVCRMAVVTSSAREHFNHIHDRMSLLKYFELVVAAGDYAREKPDPEPYLVALNRLQVRPQNCIAVEDSPRGLRAAIGAGIHCIVIRSHLTAKYSFDGAYAVVDTTAQLSGVLQTWCEKHGAAKLNR